MTLQPRVTSSMTMSNTTRDFIAMLGEEIEDPEEEAFFLFSQSIPSQNLGFVDSKATTLELTVGGRDLIISQSPTVLASSRGGGTTGAVVWKITPLVAAWLSSPNIFFENNILSSSSAVLELGCGISGIIALALSPRIKSYVLTDQDYVMKLLNQNISGNQQETHSSSKGRKSGAKSKKGAATPSTNAGGNVTARSLDWETDEVTTSLTGSDSTHSFDAVIACDCIYNDALIQPFVQTCIDSCKLRLSDTTKDEPAICIVAQQLRSPEVFEEWLKAFHKAFRVWRLPDETLIDGLKTDSGFVVHVGILRP